ncbi:MAG: phasin family protein [Parvibaculum sp.]|uniref:phasin family protein n=1 Tax=Parvibaculum sp. TaxID=2024848 RepID=UPI002841FFE6|nr:phasin family protein [Parvibaculum sp.]MDR3497768.1 phasin family protein [Parvibaculum sp.]
MTETTSAPKASKTKKTAKAKPAAAKKAKAAPKKTPVELAQGIITELARTNFEETVETAKAVLKSGNIRTAVELQNEFVRAAFKRNLDAAREINELAVSAVREAVSPYAEKFTDAFEKLRAA